MSWLRNLGQYRPYAFAVVLVVAVANLAPSSGGTSGRRPASVQPAGPIAATTTTSAAIATAAGASPGAPLPDTGTAASPRRGPGPTSTVAEATGGDADVARAPRPTALTITASGYASDATAVGDPEVGDDGLPVGAGPAGPSRISFVRLGGTATDLHLTLVPEDGAHRLPELAEVMACPITDDWEPGRDQAMSEAPPHDCSDGALARRPDATTFTFDLSGFPSPTPAHGFALVPAGDTTGFHVTFSIDALGGN